jgi:amino acid transporter
MSRDGRLPLSQVWSQVHPNLGTPIYAVIIAAVIGAVPLVASQQIGVIAGGATGLIYLAYTLTNTVLLIARLRG